MNKLGFIVLFLTCLTFTFCQDLITFQDSFTSLNNTVQEATNILSSYDWLAPLNSASWTYTEKGTIWNGYLTLSNFVLSNPPYIQLQNTASMNTNSVTINGRPDSLKIVINFSYTARTGTVTFPTGNGVMVLTPFSLTINKREAKSSDNIQTVSADINLLLNSTVVFTTGNVDDVLQGYLSKVLVGNVDNYLKSTSSGLSNSFNNFYYIQSRARPTSYGLETQQPDTNYTFSLNYLIDPTYETKGITYYFDGLISRKPASKNGFLQKENEVTVGPSFDPNDGQFQLYFSYNVIKNILGDISNSSSFLFNIDNQNLKVQSYHLSVDFLAKVIPNIRNSFPLDTQLFVVATVKGYSPISKDFRMGSAVVEFNVMANKTPVFSFYTTINFVLTVTLDISTGSFNLRLNTIDIVTSTINYNLYGQVEIETLNEYVAEGFRNYLSSGNAWNLFKNNINLLYLFKSISKLDIQDHGLLIAGEPAANPQIKKFERELKNF